DGNPPGATVRCELWSKLPDHDWAYAGSVCGDGRNGETKSLEARLDDVDGHPGGEAPYSNRLCLRIRQYNDGGYSQFSNAECLGGETPPRPPAALVIGNGVLMCDAVNQNCNFMPRVNEAFRLRWAVCNGGGTASAAATARLVSQTDHQDGNRLMDFPIPSLQPNQCTTQQTVPVTVNQVSDWHWDVLIDGRNTGNGLGWSFWCPSGTVEMNKMCVPE